MTRDQANQWGSTLFLLVVLTVLMFGCGTVEVEEQEELPQLQDPVVHDLWWRIGGNGPAPRVLMVIGAAVKEGADGLYDGTDVWISVFPRQQLHETALVHELFHALQWVNHGRVEEEHEGYTGPIWGPGQAVARWERELSAMRPGPVLP